MHIIAPWHGTESGEHAVKYLSVAEARPMNGLRLALTVQTPGPWGISARALFDLRRVPFVPVRQDVMAPNEELVAWTGRRNAPVAIYNDEPAVDGWLEIMNMAERLGSGPSLYPDDPVDRALAVGFSAEICGQGGFGWARRLAMQPPGEVEAEDDTADKDAISAQIKGQYGMRPGVLSESEQRVIGILNGLSAQLHRQRKAGSPYLVGDRLSACDVHWACFSMLIAPLAREDCPMEDYLHTIFATMSEPTRAALDPILIEHRDLVWRDHIGLPLDYLPD